MSENRWFDIREAINKGTALLFVGQPYSGKTTIIKELIKKVQEVGIGDGEMYRGTQLPFPVLVHAPISTLIADYSDVKGIHRMHVEPTVKRFHYYSSRYRNSLVILEDISRWLRGGRRSRTYDLLARRRKKSFNCSLIATLNSLWWVKEYGFLDVFSHLVLFGRVHSIPILRSLFDKGTAREIITRLSEMETIHDFIIYDLKRKIMTTPLYGDPLPICYALLDRVEQLSETPTIRPTARREEIMDEELKLPTVEQIDIVEVVDKEIQIKKLYEVFPWLPLKSVAKRVGTTVSYVSKVRWKYGLTSISPKEARQNELPELADKFVKMFELKE